MQKVLTLLVSFISIMAYGQTDTAAIIADAQAYQDQLNIEYADQEHSPLTEEGLEHFEGLPFYEIDPSFCVDAKFKKVRKPKTFEMKTTTDRLPVYDVYAYVIFELGGVKHKVPVYQSHKLREMDEFKSYLFLPFNDPTNGGETYGGGRFLDLEIPEGKTIVIDFNRAYNPYCAYNGKYSCPVPPKENYIEVPIRAGVMAPEDH